MNFFSLHICLSSPSSLKYPISIFVWDDDNRLSRRRRRRSRRRPWYKHTLQTDTHSRVTVYRRQLDDSIMIIKIFRWGWSTDTTGLIQRNRTGRTQEKYRRGCYQTVSKSLRSSRRRRPRRIISKEDFKVQNSKKRRHGSLFSVPGENKLEGNEEKVWEKNVHFESGTEEKRRD